MPHHHQISHFNRSELQGGVDNRTVEDRGQGAPSPPGPLCLGTGSPPLAAPGWLRRRKQQRQPRLGLRLRPSANAAAAALEPGVWRRNHSVSERRVCWLAGAFPVGVASMHGRTVSERLRTWVPAALGPGASPPAPRGTGTCRRAPSPVTDRRRPSLVPAQVRDSAPLPSSLGGPGTPVSARSRLCPRCPVSNRCRTSPPPSHRPGTPSCPPRAALAPKSWPGPWSGSLSRRSCPFPAHCIPLPQPG